MGGGACVHVESVHLYPYRYSGFSDRHGQFHLGGHKGWLLRSVGLLEYIHHPLRANP